MSQILNGKLRKFLPGYPTVSDKYEVEGRTLTGEKTVEFGDILKWSDESGYVEKYNPGDDVSLIAGIALATNVKLPDDPLGENTVVTRPGEAVNRFFAGWIAVKLDENAVADDIKPNAVVKITNDATITTSSQGGTALENWKFTGEQEEVDGDLYAEIHVIE